MSSPITSQGLSVIYRPLSTSLPSYTDYPQQVGEVFSLESNSRLGEGSFVCSSSQSSNLLLRDALGVCYLGESLSSYTETYEQALQISRICYGSQVMGICHIGDFSNIRSSLGSVVVKNLLTTWDRFFSQNPDKFLLQCFLGDGCFPINKALQHTPHRDKIVLLSIDSSSPVIHNNQHIFYSLGSSQSEKASTTVQYRRLFSCPTSDPAFSPILLRAFYSALLSSPKGPLYASELRGIPICLQFEKESEHTYESVKSNPEALEYLYLSSNVGLCALRIADYTHLLIKESAFSSVTMRNLLSPIRASGNLTIVSVFSFANTSLISFSDSPSSSNNVAYVTPEATVLSTSQLANWETRNVSNSALETLSSSLARVITNATTVTDSFTTSFFNASSFADTVTVGQYPSSQVTPSTFSSVMSEIINQTSSTSALSWSSTGASWTTSIPAPRRLSAVTPLVIGDVNYRHALTLAAFWAAQGILYGCLLGMRSHGVKSGTEGLAAVLAGGLLVGGFVDHLANLWVIVEGRARDFTTTSIRVTLVAYGTFSLINETIWLVTPCLKQLIRKAINKARERKGWERLEKATIGNLAPSYRSLSRKIRTIGTSLCTLGVLTVGVVSTIVTVSTDNLSLADGTECVLLFAKSLVILSLFLSLLRAFGR